MASILFGKANLLQASMLLLAGYSPAETFGSHPVSTSDRLSLISKGRKYLVARTGLDFGFDLAGWHKALQESQEFREEYTFPYAWSFVNSKVEDALLDSERRELIKKIVECI